MSDDHRPRKADEAQPRKKHARSANRPAASRSHEDIPIEVAAGGVWAARPVSAQPMLRLAHWQIYKVRKVVVFVGYNLDDREGRVSSAIQSLDVAARRGVTASGRIYQLVGSPGYHEDGEWVFGIWLRMCRIRRTAAKAISLEGAARMLAE